MGRAGRERRAPEIARGASAVLLEHVGDVEPQAVHLLLSTEAAAEGPDEADDAPDRADRDAHLRFEDELKLRRGRFVGEKNVVRRCRYDAGPRAGADVDFVVGEPVVEIPTDDPLDDGRVDGGVGLAGGSGRGILSTDLDAGWEP